MKVESLKTWYLLFIEYGRLYFSAGGTMVSGTVQGDYRLESCDKGEDISIYPSHHKQTLPIFTFTHPTHF